MSSKLILVVQTNTDGATTAAETSINGVGSGSAAGPGAWERVRAIADFLTSQAMGRGIKIWYSDTAISASTTGTFTGSPTAGQALTVNGQAFTARASSPAANEFVIGSSVTDAATNLAAAINASTTAGIVGVIGASSAAGVITVYSIAPGPVGKSIAISENMDNFTLSDTTLSTGGTLAHSAIISAGV